MVARLRSRYQVPAVGVRVTDPDGNAIPGGYSWYLTKGEVKDWFKTNSPQVEVMNARVTQTVYSELRSANPAPGTWDPADPVWFQGTGGNKQSFLEIDPAGGSRWLTVWSTTLSGTVPLAKTHWSTDTTLIRDEDYAFVVPPAGLAANLLATQSWVPYVGTADFVEEEIPAGHHVGRALNLTGSLPKYEGMKALISGHRIVLATGQQTLTLGAPDRLAFVDLVSRFRQNGASNIEFLSGAPVG